MNSQLRGARLLVTGSEGFIGKHLVARLRTLGADVHGYDLKLGADVLDRDRLVEAVRGVDGVFHLGAPSSSLHFQAEQREPSMRTALHGLSNLLDVYSGPVLFPSTGTLYADSPVPAREEAMLPPPANPYAASKLLGEQALRHRNVRIVRIFSGYGVGEAEKLDYASALYKFVRDAVAGSELVVFGDGSQTRDFVFVEDVVEGIVLAFVAGPPGRIFNIGTGLGTSFLEVLDLIGSALGRGSRVLFRPRPAGYVGSIVSDISRARAELGFTPRMDIAEGVRRTIASLRR